MREHKLLCTNQHKRGRLAASSLDSNHISGYRCCFCNSPYPTTAHLKSHLTRGCFMDPSFSIEKRRNINRMESRNYVCPKCSQGYKNKRTLDTHLRIACGREPKFQCPYCDLKNDILIIDEDGKWHYFETLHQKESKEKDNWEDNDENLQIDKSNKTTNEGKDLKLYCGHEFSYRASYNRHKKKKHCFAAKQFRTSVVRTYTCEYCSKGFTLKRFLYAHLKKSCYWNPSSECYHAQKLKPFSCSGCGASYSKQSSLKWHVRHDCGRTLKCDDCGKTFLQSNKLELGTNNSTRGEGTKRKYSCKYCGKGFTQSGHLRSHQKSSCYWNPRSTCHQSQKIRPFSCTQCGACYSKQSHLIFHVRHECGRTQKCNICGKTFLHSSSLRRHRQRACNFQLC
ncbi:zinc finger protein 814-like [Monomorium pharaonis]|uniref:zinc finger protein 814-like n=1 Tax=Monomorium pharaonis TaxID=307658 RepID=UPI0017474671|nr:zinc finger protein 814-like [Monomorium pharaonis]